MDTVHLVPYLKRLGEREGERVRFIKLRLVWSLYAVWLGKDGSFLPLVVSGVRAVVW